MPTLDQVLDKRKKVRTLDAILDERAARRAAPAVRSTAQLPTTQPGRPASTERPPVQPGPPAQPGRVSGVRNQANVAPAAPKPPRPADWTPGEPLVSDDLTRQERLRVDKAEHLQERKREWAMRNALFPKDAMRDIDYVPRNRQERNPMHTALAERYMAERGLDWEGAVQVADATIIRAQIAQKLQPKATGRLMQDVSLAAMRTAPLFLEGLQVPNDAHEQRKDAEFAALQDLWKDNTDLPEINPAALRVMFDEAARYWGKHKDIVRAAQDVAGQGPAGFRVSTSVGLGDPYWMKYVQNDEDRRIFLFALSQFSVAKERTAGQKREAAFARGAERVLTAPKRIRELYLGGDEAKQLFIDTIHDVMAFKDPITSENIFGRGLYNAIGMVPLLLAAAATGGAGSAVKGLGARVLQAAPPVLVMSAAVAPDMYEDFLRAGIDPKTAKPMALAASLVEGIIEYAQLRGLAPGARLALGSRFSATVPGFITKHFVGPYAREWTEEAAQELSKLMFKTLADAIDDGEIEVDFSAEVARSMGDLKEAAVSLFYLMGPAMVSAGVNVRSLWAAEQSQVQLDALKQIAEEAANAIDAREQQPVQAPTPHTEAVEALQAQQAALQAKALRPTATPAVETPAAPEAVQPPEVLPDVSAAPPVEAPPTVPPPAKQPWELTKELSFLAVAKMLEVF